MFCRLYPRSHFHVQTSACWFCGQIEDNGGLKQTPDQLRNTFFDSLLVFLSQLFFPECMISDSADVSKGMTSSELIQVRWEPGASIAVQLMSQFSGEQDVKTLFHLCRYLKRRCASSPFSGFYSFLMRVK